LEPLNFESYFEKIVLVNNAIETETVTAPKYPLPKSFVVYVLDAFLFP
jgi:hypothetical protein